MENRRSGRLNHRHLHPFIQPFHQRGSPNDQPRFPLIIIIRHQPAWAVANHPLHFKHAIDQRLIQHKNVDGKSDGKFSHDGFPVGQQWFVLGLIVEAQWTAVIGIQRSVQGRRCFPPGNGDSQPFMPTSR